MAEGHYGDARPRHAISSRRGQIGVPLDAEVELLRETGRLVFLAGTVEQDGDAWSPPSPAR